jgi:DNA-binding IclR family transcriptional regulator
VPDGDTILYVDMVESRHSLRMAAVVGSRDSLVTTALGKAYLAFLHEDQLSDVLRRASFTPRTPRSIRTPDTLRRELERVRREGHAIDNEENEIGAYCIGAPVFGIAGDAVGAISVSVPLVRLDEQRRIEMIDAVTETARCISRDLGMSFNRSSPAGMRAH